jgi:hypothetical protein
MTEDNYAPQRGVLTSVDIDAGRRAFVRSLGFGIAGAAVVGAMPGLSAEAHAQAITDADVLTFALNLEYLEAEFYLRAVFGRGLHGDDVRGHQGPPGDVTGGSRVPFKDLSLRRIAKEIASDEEKHVQFLRAALGRAQVARPAINLKQSFTQAARAAGVIGAKQQFDPFADEDSFLLGAFIFEDVGVTAYKGAAPLLADKGLLAAAAGILAVEAYHAGTIRTLLYQRELFDAAGKISDLRDTVDGPEDKDQGVGGANGANIVPTDDNGVAFDRTPREVLNIVYLGTNRSKGGFFPNGLNGPINK